MSIVTQPAADRLAEAALLLLDAAREVAKESPTYRTGEPNLEATLSLSAQALIMADHWHMAGQTGIKIPKGFQERWMGVAHGLGVTIGLVNNPSVQTIAMMAAAQTIHKGVAVGAATLKGAK